MVTTLHVLALVVYGGVGALLGRSLARGEEGAPPGTAALIAGAVALHAAALGAYTVRFDELPLVGLAPSLSTFALLVGVFLLLATGSLRETRPIGLVLAPLVALLLAAALALGIRPAPEALAFRGAWFSLHVIFAFLGHAALAVAFAAGLMYLLQFRELKGKHFGRMFRFFPPLETLDRLGRAAIVAGFPALTTSLVLGWAWTVRFQHSFEAGSPKVQWAVFTWLVFAAALAARFGGQGRERRGALVSVIGFAAVVLAYVVLRVAESGRLFL
jgi:HemX protein